MPRERDPPVARTVNDDDLDSLTRSIDLNVAYNGEEISNTYEPRCSEVVNRPRLDTGAHEQRQFQYPYAYQSRSRIPWERNPLVVGRVVGDVLDSFTRSIDLTMSYNNRDVTNGAELRPSQVVNRPRVDVGGHDLRTFYTLVLVDADAPSPSDPDRGEYLHWLVTDIPATTAASFGHEQVRYESPSPSIGIHRFVLVLFQQLGRRSVFAPERRQRFNTRDFVELHNLGLPVAALYFNCLRERGLGGRRI